MVDYIYDVENRWIGENVDVDGDGTFDHQTKFIYDGNQIVLQFDKSGTDTITNADLSHRYLWRANAVDQLLADEQITNPQTPGNVVWPLTDNLGTVRDLAVYDAATGETSVVNHRTFDAFGNLKSSINPTTNQAAAVDCIFGWTGRPVSKATGLQNNLNRWYDPIVAGWISQDPIGFKSGTTNLYVYCGNSPINLVDPSGLKFRLIGNGFCGHYEILVDLRDKAGNIIGTLSASFASGDGGAFWGTGKLIITFTPGATVGGPGAIDRGANADNAVVDALLKWVGQNRSALDARIAAGNNSWFVTYGLYNCLIRNCQSFAFHCRDVYLYDGFPYDGL